MEKTAKEMTPTQLSRTAKIGSSFAWEIMNGKRNPSRRTAYKIYDATGLQYGHLANLTKRQITTLRKLEA